MAEINVDSLRFAVMYDEPKYHHGDMKYDLLEVIDAYTGDYEMRDDISELYALSYDVEGMEDCIDFTEDLITCKTKAELQAGLKELLQMMRVELDVMSSATESMSEIVDKY